MRRLPGVDLALLPFWYVEGESNRRMVAEVIRPKRIVGMHLPPSEWPAVSEKLRAAGVQVVLPRDPRDAGRSDALSREPHMIFEGCRTT